MRGAAQVLVILTLLVRMWRSRWKVPAGPN